MSFSPADGCAAPIAACAALTSDDFPMPRAPHNKALLAGRLRAKRSVFSTNRSRTRSIPFNSDMSTRLTRRTAASLRPSGCQTKASAAEKSSGAGAVGARRSNAPAIRINKAVLSFPASRVPEPLPAVVFVAFAFERGGDLAMFTPGCGHPLSEAAACSQACPKRARNIAIGPTLAIVRAILRAKAALHPGRRASCPPHWRTYVHYARICAK